MKRMHTDEEIQKLAASPIGDVSIDGDLTVDGDFEANSVSADSIVENMSGYTVTIPTLPTGLELTYLGVVKNGNKLTFAAAFHANFTTVPSGGVALADFKLPPEVDNKIVPFLLGDTNYIDIRKVTMAHSGTGTTDILARFIKYNNNVISINLRFDGATANREYYARYECTFLLSENLAS